MTRMKRNRSSLGAVLLRSLMLTMNIWALHSSAPLAQTTMGALRGVVADESRGVLPGATVTVTNLHTEITRTVLTDEAGRYAVLSLPAAPYRLQAERTGFAPTIRERVTLEVAQTLEIDFTLKIAGAQEKVVVTAEAPLLSKETAELGGHMDTKRLVELPISGRGFTRFGLLVPGVSAISSAIHDLSFNGHNVSYNNFTLDGIDATLVYLQITANGYTRGAQLLTGSLDSMQEFRVHTANYQAEYGRAIGGIVNIVSKSGGNALHGTLFEFLRNSALDARNFFAPPDQPKPLYILHQFGGNLSGPIVKGRTFYFLNYEGSRQRLDLTGQGTVPSPALRQRILATSPALAPLLATIPLGTARTTNPDVDNYATVRGTSVREDTGSIKIDHRFSDRDTFFARYNVNDTLVSGANTLDGGLLLATDQLQRVPFRTTNVTMQEQHAFSAHRINEFKVGMQRVANKNILTTRFPETRVTGLTIRPGSRQGSRVEGMTAYQVIDNFSLSHGPHAFKTGFEVRRTRINLHREGSATMAYNNLEDFVHNRVASASLTPGTPSRGLRQVQYGFYFQDDFKVRRSLTLNLGLRYEYYTVFREVRDRVQVFNPLSGELDPPGAPWYRPDRNNFAPRFGFAWSPRPSDKTLVRGGFGLYYISWSAFPITIPSNIFANNIPGTTTLLRSQVPDLSFPLERFVGSGAIRPPSVNAINPQRRDLYTEQWTLNLQRALGPSMIGQVAYVGNRGINLYRHWNMNLVDPALGRRPNPRFADILLHENTAQSVYHSLQVSLRRRWGRGLAFDTAYTYGHAIDDQKDEGSFVRGAQDSQNLRAERGNGLRDVRHNLALNGLYDLPFGPKRAFLGHTSGLVGQWLGGWQLNGLGILRTGSPFTVELSGTSPSGNGNTINQRPDRVPGVSSEPANRSINNWLNRAAFAEPRPGTFGNLGRNTERGPGLIQIDLSLLKTTKLSETKSLQLRAEFFNVLNHPNFAHPSAQFRDATAFGRVFSILGSRIGFGTPRQIQFGLKYLF